MGEQLWHDYPQLRLCLSGDALFGCGEGLQIAKDYRFDYVYVFKEGRLPTVWADFQGLLPLVPEQRVELWTPQGTKQVYRWINELSYRDSANRPWQFNAVQCEQTTARVNKRCGLGDESAGEPEHRDRHRHERRTAALAHRESGL